MRLLVGREQDRVEVLLGQLVADALDPLAAVAVGAVGDRRPEHPERDLLAVHRGLQRRLELGGALLVRPRQCAQVALAREAPELDRAEAAVARFLHAPRPLERRDVLVLAVDRLELELLLQAGVVVVVLLVEVRDEAVDPLPVLVQLT